ncbi:hypothetical protein HK099_002050 [Clydaea vesicula]|uniref:Uncharacterized protein n=1 Tax=Clydaea vesicula TaxID=447962 RepID=A0AAD5U4L2_9FUNG|nr:hypothetical protein HK099_002050 [Clydaea vesicula]
MGLSVLNCIGITNSLYSQRTTQQSLTAQQQQNIPASTSQHLKRSDSKFDANFTTSNPPLNATSFALKKEKTNVNLLKAEKQIIENIKSRIIINNKALKNREFWSVTGSSLFKNIFSVSKYLTKYPLEVLQRRQQILLNLKYDPKKFLYLNLYKGLFHNVCWKISFEVVNFFLIKVSKSLYYVEKEESGKEYDGMVVDKKDLLNSNYFISLLSRSASFLVTFPIYKNSLLLGLNSSALSNSPTSKSGFALLLALYILKDDFENLVLKNLFGLNFLKFILKAIEPLKSQLKKSHLQKSQFNINITTDDIKKNNVKFKNSLHLKFKSIYVYLLLDTLGLAISEVVFYPVTTYKTLDVAFSKYLNKVSNHLNNDYLFM